MRHNAREKMRRSTEFPGKIKALREATGMNQVAFAEALGVARSLLAACESVSSKSRKPSTDMLVRLGSVAAEERRYDDAKWFWEKAGMSTSALDNLIDLRVREKAASAGDFIEISALDPAIKEIVPFPARLLKNPASTRFLRLRTTRKVFTIADTEFGPSTAPFSAGDTLLIDPSKTDLRSIGQGALISVRIKARDGINYHEYAGTLNRVFFGDGNHYWLGMKDRNVLIGYSSRRSPRETDGPVVMVGLDSRVLGCLVAWIRAEAKE
jgi:transcriptional regulator with XRE-family HTH domain